MIVVMTRTAGSNEYTDSWGIKNGSPWCVIAANGDIRYPDFAEDQDVGTPLGPTAAGIVNCQVGLSSFLPNDLAEDAVHVSALFFHLGGGGTMTLEQKQEFCEKALAGVEIQEADRLVKNRSFRYTTSGRTPESLVGIQLMRIADAVKELMSTDAPTSETKKTVMAQIGILKRAIEDAGPDFKRYDGIENCEQRTKALAYWLSFRGIRGKREELAKLILPFAFDVKTLVELDPDEHCRKAIFEAVREWHPGFSKALNNIRADIEKMVNTVMENSKKKEEAYKEEAYSGKNIYGELASLLNLEQGLGKTALDELALIVNEKTPSEPKFPGWADKVLKKSTELVDAIDAVDEIPRKF